MQGTQTLRYVLVHRSLQIHPIKGQWGPQSATNYSGFNDTALPCRSQNKLLFLQPPCRRSAHARLCDSRQLGKHRKVFLSIWCLVSFRSRLIEVRWLVMCCALLELLILRILFSHEGNRKCGKHDCFCITGLLLIITNHSMRSSIDHLTRPQWQAAVLLSLREYWLHLSALETTALFELGAWACQQ